MPELRTKPASRLTKVLYVSSIPLATLLAAAGCVTAPTSAAPSSTAAVFASPVPSPSPEPNESPEGTGDAPRGWGFDR